jgi:hypothetical protein
MSYWSLVSPVAGTVEVVDGDTLDCQTRPPTHPHG